MKLAVVFSLLFVGVFGHLSNVASKESDLFEGIQKLIIGGEVAQSKQLPYHVLIHSKLLVNGKIISSLCGGAVISNKHIITAAHCLHGTVGGNMYLGISRIRNVETTRVVIKLKPSYFHIHEEYNPRSDVNDIALVTLPSPIEMNDGIKIVRLPSASLDTLDNRIGVISGFGKTGDKFDISNELRFVRRKILPDIFCRSTFVGFMSKTQICVDGSEKKSACPGDSGGPLVITEDDGIPTVVGVTSYGKVSCESGSPSVYTRLSAYLDWINKHTSISIRK